MTEDEEDYLSLVREAFGEEAEKINRTIKNCRRVLNYENFCVIGGATVVKLAPKIYSIHDVVIKPIYRRQGKGSNLMLAIKTNYEGLLLVKTQKAASFYTALGFIDCGGVLAYCNDTEFLRRCYYK